LGSYEYEKRRTFEETISEGNVVFDVGAHVGFYSLLASTLVGPTGWVVAFEPAPRNLDYLREHLRLNGVRNVDVVACAVLESTGVAWFEDGVDSSSGRVSAIGQYQVSTIGLDEYVSQSARVPDCIKIDVEGAEWSVLRGAMSTLKKHHPAIFLATHGCASHDRCCEALRALGYDLYPIVGECAQQTDELYARPADETPY